MQVNTTPYVNYADTVQPSSLNTNTNENSAINEPKSTETDTVSISNAALNAEAKWQAMSDKYDMTNISGNEVLDMARELFDSNLTPILFKKWN